MPAPNEQASPVQVRVVRSFAAPAERVFDAWLDPTSIGKWMCGPALRDEEVLHLEIDPRVGGKFSFLVRRQGTEIDHVGTDTERSIVPDAWSSPGALPGRTKAW